MNRSRIRGHLRLEGRGGTLRTAHNLVLRGGAEVVAQLFAGAGGAAPIDTIGVGFARESADADVTALSPPEDGTIPASALVTPLGPDAFAIRTDRPNSIRVTVTAVFRPAVNLPGVSEAGLLSGPRLYNQVVFEPVDLEVGQDVTFFWDIDFPFGH